MSITDNGRPPLVADRRYVTASKATGGSARAKTPPKAKPTARKRRPARKPTGFFGGIFRWIFRVLWGIGWRLTVLLAIVVGTATLYFYQKLPDVTDLLDARARGSVTLLDRDGAVFAWRGETFGGQIDAASVSPNLRNAVIATEDRRFYWHFGVSPRGIISAIVINLKEGRGPLEGNGGSTITQQVAKLLCLGVPYDPATWKSEAEYEADCRQGGLVRKIKEVPFALALEAKYSKNEVLTIYLNRAYLGAGTRGFEAAAQRYFGKSANEVSPAEAAMLAGLLKAPSYYAPTNDLNRARERAGVIVGLMEEQGYLTAAEADEARRNPAKLSEAAATRSGGFFADWVMESGPAYLTSETTEDVIISTTLDQRIQKAAEEALADVFSSKIKDGSKAQAAIVVMSSDGAVRAMVGGRKIELAGSFNRATQALRQTGSAFKPFVYAAALDLGYSPADYVDDSPLTINIPGSGPWSPSNYDHEFHGVMTLTQALQESRNIPAVRVSEAVGRDLVRQVASQFGIQSDLAAGPALALGASEATLIDMTGAYAGILNGGQSVKPYGLVELRLQAEDTPLMGQEGGLGERVISEQAALELSYMLTQVVEHGTGRRAALDDRQVAGKTGTTQAARDAWFVGFSADYVAGVWMGYDDNTPLTGVTGAGLPAEIWHEVMVRVHEGLPAKDIPMIIPEPRQPPQAATAASEPGQPAEAEPGSSGNSHEPDQAEGILRQVLNAFKGN